MVAMPYRMEFEHLLEYDTREAGIVISVALVFGQNSIDVAAKLDCGASACVFERSRGET
jgi:hypothetical protein